MSRVPVKTRSSSTALRTREPEITDVVPVPQRSSGFFSFSYCVTELSTHGGRTSVKSKQTRFENGTLTTESFEGEADAGVFDDALQQAERQLLGHLDAMLKPLTWWLPMLPGRKRSGRE